MNKFILIKIVLLLTILSISGYGYGQSTRTNCTHNGIVAGFYNGVFNTPESAHESMVKLQLAIGAKTSKAVDIQWEVFYNTSESLWADLVETFDQKAKAQNVYVAEI